LGTLNSAVDKLKVTDVNEIDMKAVEKMKADVEAVEKALVDATDMMYHVGVNAMANVTNAKAIEVSKKVETVKGETIGFKNKLDQLAGYANKVAAETVEAAEQAVADATTAVETARVAADTKAEADKAKAAAEDALTKFEGYKTGATAEEVLAAAKALLDAALKAMEAAQVAAEEAQKQADQAAADYNASLQRVDVLRKQEAYAYAQYMSWLASVLAGEETIEDEQVPLADLSASEGRELKKFGDEMFVYDAEGNLVKNEFSVFEDANGTLYMVFTDEDGKVVKNMFIVEDEDGNYELVTAEAMNEDEDIDFEEVFVYWAGEDGIIVRDDEVEVLDYIYTADEEGVIVSREEKEEEAIA
ncbi:MAG: hypothetical protein IJD26_00270, partial [Lachnospiraceae bacterium]|nr:hypothetical protein [Lachnospiraceae bacterium]